MSILVPIASYYTIINMIYLWAQKINQQTVTTTNIMNWTRSVRVVDNKYNFPRKIENLNWLVFVISYLDVDVLFMNTVVHQTKTTWPSKTDSHSLLKTIHNINIDKVNRLYVLLFELFFVIFHQYFWFLYFTVQFFETLTQF